MHLNVVVTCTDRKTVLPSAAFRVRNLQAASSEQRAREWLKLTQSDGEARVSAEKLYAGDHWRVAMGLETLRQAEGLSIRLWVMSAGYGLISPRSEIIPYAATFSARHPDYVSTNGGGGCQAWWEILTHSGSGTHTPSSLGTLAELYDDTPLVVVASRDYLVATQCDLKYASKALQDPSLLTVLSGAPSDNTDESIDHVKTDARLQGAIGGARQSLNIRVLRHLLAEWPLEVPVLRYHVRDRLQELIAGQPMLRRYDHVPMTDTEVREWVRQALRADPRASKSQLLRKLRDSERACEQARFGGLFLEAKEQVIGG